MVYCFAKSNQQETEMNLFLAILGELPSLRVRLRLAYYGSSFSVFGVFFSCFHEQLNNPFYSLVCFLAVLIGVVHILSIPLNLRAEKTLRKKCEEAGVPYAV